MNMLKVAVFAVAMIFATAPAHAMCVPWEGPPGVYARLNDPNFATDECWTFTSNTYHGGTNQVGVLTNTGSISQATSFFGESWSMYEIVIDVNAITDGSPGSERLRIEILNSSGQIVETADIITPTSGDDNYYYLLENDYDNQNITVRARYVPGTTPGGTTFEIDNFSMWLTP